MILRGEYGSTGNAIPKTAGLSRLSTSSIVAMALIAGIVGLYGSVTMKRAEAAAEPVLRFADVEGHWAERDVYHLAAKRLVSGRGAGLFFPQSPVTRAEFLKLLVGSLGLNSAAQEMAASPHLQPYRDVPDTHWAKAYIALAAELGLVRGYTDGTFHPEEYVTRAEIAAMLVRAVHYGMGASPESVRFTVVSRENGVGGEGLALPFDDAAFIPAWARDSVSSAFEMGLLKGYPDGTFKPNARTSRAEAAVISRRILLLLGNDYDYSGVVVRASGSAPGGGSTLQARTSGEGGMRDAAGAGSIDGAQGAEGTGSTGKAAAKEDAGGAVLEIRPYAAIGVGEAGVFDESGGPGRPWPSYSTVASGNRAGEPTVKVRLSDGALIYRNGKRVDPAQILPSDEAFMIFGQKQEAIFVDMKLVEDSGVVERFDVNASILFYVPSRDGRGAGGTGEDLVLRTGGLGDSPGLALRSARVADGAVVSRNGKKCDPTGIHAGDEVHLVFDSVRGRIRIVNAERFDSEGEITRVDVRGKSVTLKGPMGEKAFFWSPDAVAFRSAARIGFESLKPGDSLRVALDESGAVYYAEVIAADE